MPPKVPERSIAVEAKLAARIQHERERRGMSPAGLASRMTKAGCAMNQSAIWKIENGQPRRRITVDELVAFSKVFEMDLAELLRPVEDVAVEEAHQAMLRIQAIAMQYEGLESEIDDAWNALARAISSPQVLDAMSKMLGGIDEVEAWLDGIEFRVEAAQLGARKAMWADWYARQKGADGGVDQQET